MKHLLAFLAVISCVAASAQFDNAQFPYNPDVEPDGYIGVGDVLQLLATFGQQFSVATLSADSSSALVDIGSVDYFECSRSCKQLGREWDMMDIDGLSQHADTLFTYNESAWVKSDPAASGWMLTVSLGTALGTFYVQSQPLVSNQCFCTARIYPELEYTYLISSNSATFENECTALLNDGWRPLGGINVATPGNSVLFSQSFWRYVP